MLSNVDIISIIYNLDSADPENNCLERKIFFVEEKYKIKHK